MYQYGYFLIFTNSTHHSGLKIAALPVDPARQFYILGFCTMAGLNLWVLRIKGAIMLAWFMTDVIVFVLGLSLWMWVMMKRG
jgi:hypothetical protein